jgi:hypothetical protein
MVMINNPPKTKDQYRLPMSHLVLLFLTLCASSFLAGCGSTTELSSTWNNNQVTIDGDANEWHSGLTNLKDTKLFVGIQNDQDFMYLCLTSPDRQFRRQLVGTGLTVWFESEGGHRVGVLYPIGMLGQGRQPLISPDETPGGDEREHIVEQTLSDLEILGPGKDDKNLFSIVQSPGISVKVGGSQGSSVYELKVPLRKSNEHPYAVEASVGSTVNISIETGKFDPGSRPGAMGEGMREGGGGRPRSGGMPGGGMRGGGRRGGEGPQGARPEPLDVSLKVRLAGSASAIER